MPLVNDQYGQGVACMTNTGCKEGINGQRLTDSQGTQQKLATTCSI